MGARAIPSCPETRSARGVGLRASTRTLAAPDYIGQRPRADRRRVEFVRLVDEPSRWLLVSVKFLDEKREAWVNSAYPIADAHLTRRLRAGTLWTVSRGP